MEDASVEFIPFVAGGWLSVWLFLSPSDVVSDRNLYALPRQAFGQLGRLGHTWKTTWTVDGKGLCEGLGEHLAPRAGRCARLGKSWRTNRDEFECETELTLLSNAEVGEDEEAGSGAVQVTSNVGAGYQTTLEHSCPRIRWIVRLYQD